jgi:gp45 sliding clamp, C terminal
MKISKATIDILRNFASINQNILINEGNVLTTRTVAKNLFATATVDTEFPKEFGIYNLSTFLGVLSLFSDPDVELGTNSMIISQGKNRVQYTFAAPEVLDYPDKAIKLPSVDAEFELTEENLKSLLKAGAVLSSTDLCIAGDGTTITCSTIDPKNPSANTFSVEVGTTDRTFKAFIKLENLKVPTGSYNVRMSVKKMTEFENKTISYSMIVANTKDSIWS